MTRYKNDVTTPLGLALFSYDHLIFDPEVGPVRIPAQGAHRFRSKACTDSV
jgi:hypothetical protein